ncbi:MAG: N-acetylglutaminylglutamine amidotransferase [Alphaproteobacteria bacterium]|nr:N-acetylglutaminylglutamine amidotransferase [Alphaproteobacteria bacterium]
MCGICGEVRFDSGMASAKAIADMCEVMRPRGPDAGGAIVRDRVGLGHRRLRIIDLSARGNQPMSDPELGLSLAFNGCIYNYKELRAELQASGYRFFSDSDTEVILKAYAAWGTDCVKRFNGMFAFAIHERDSGRVVLARDRLGIKPLYLAEARIDGSPVMRFASSLPALLATKGIDRSIDPIALHHYMTFHSVVPPPYTMIKGIRKLPPATVSVIEPDGTRSDKVYWEPSFIRTAEDLRTSAEEWEQRVHDALIAAVKRRMVADVPVGVLLSGGVDSSLIVGLLAEAGQSGLKTFSVGFESVGGEEGNEFRYSDLIAQHYGTEHFKIPVPTDEMIAALPATINAMAEPMVSHDNVGFYLLSREVTKHVRVVQSGQGADEIYGGYHWYPPLAKSNAGIGDYAEAFFDRDHAEFCKAVTPEFAGEADHSLEFASSHFSKPGADDAVDKALRIDTQVMLADDPVKRVDNMTMAWGLEARVPFLDHELVELSAKIPPEHKLKHEGKGVLKDVARKVIPHEVIDRPKGYFPVPALKYIEGRVWDMVNDAVSSEAARTRGIFQRDYVDMLLSDPRGHITRLRGSKLWQVALLEMWLQSHKV